MCVSAQRIGWLVVGLAGVVALCACGGSMPTQPATPACQESRSALGAPGTPGRSWEGTVLVDGACREYVVHVPASYDPGRATPLVVAMHGYTGSPSSMEASSGLSRTADAAGFIAVYPAGIARAWDLSPGGRDTRFLRALVVHLQGRATIDRRRVFVTGFSMGGGMANRAACDLADVVAAAAPASGSYQGYAACTPQRPVSILAFHGSADTVVPPMGTSGGLPAVGLWLMAWGQRDGCNPSATATDRGGVTETSFPGCSGGTEVRLLMVEGLGHAWWPPANDELWEFFERHPLP
jgi:polyhydroxybutyrate depolymerase